MDEEDDLEAVEFFDREGICFRNQKYSGRKRGGCS
ncbi:hypothetical protein DHOM_11415 [Dermabacter hominis 1368]|uniref:Uncharacterized protein n=1 Tax=Dermabacter hominis 1368 TaxID=1450519 RepID=A0ABR4SGV4_9MICO|nr:hypothetical protein DHOM_11415 [Dermabacter hominis 1368]